MTCLADPQAREEGLFFPAAWLPRGAVSATPPPCAGCRVPLTDTPCASRPRPTTTTDHLAAGVSDVAGAFLTGTPFKGTQDSKGQFIVSVEGSKCQLTYALKATGKAIPLASANTTASNATAAAATPAGKADAAKAGAAGAKAGAEPAKKSGASAAGASSVLVAAALAAAAMLL